MEIISTELREVRDAFAAIAPAPSRITKRGFICAG
jgi:hypothetical protein